MDFAPVAQTRGLSPLLESENIEYRPMRAVRPQLKAFP